MTEPRLSWTQPVCNTCWAALQPGRKPVRLKLPLHETCCYCGVDTQSGIFVRVDPKTVKFPTHEKDD